jgi:ubiquinone/menaquinone biosynthesis C-methylase UbiE
MNKKEFNDFFKSYALNVDNANSLAFWKLSDDLVTAVIKKHIPDLLSPEQVILDAGGGTGRWVCDLSKIYKSSFIVYDLSQDMLGVAKKNILHAGIGDRVKLVQGDLTDMSIIPDNSVDYIVSIYSPISFVYEKEKAISELFRILKKGGKLIIMGHGFYNALASKINNYQAPVTELNMMDTESMVKWGDHVPKLNIFSKESMEKLLIDRGFDIVTTYGLPVFIQPGPEDWDALNKEKSRISKALENKEFYRQVFELEMEHNSKPEVANRGMNIFTVAKK